MSRIKYFITQGVADGKISPNEGIELMNAYSESKVSKQKTYTDSALTARNYWDELIERGEAKDFTKLTSAGISLNYENVFEFAEAYSEARIANSELKPDPEICNHSWGMYEAQGMQPQPVCTKCGKSA